MCFSDYPFFPLPLFRPPFPKHLLPMTQLHWYLQHLPQLTALCKAISSSRQEDLLSHILDLCILSKCPQDLPLLFIHLKHYCYHPKRKKPIPVSSTIEAPLFTFNIEDLHLPQIFCMHAIDDLTFKQIALLTNKSESTVRRLYWRQFYDMRSKFSSKKELLS